MSTRILGPLLLLALWFALWGNISYTNLFSGLVVVGVVSSLYRRSSRGCSYKIHLLGLFKLVMVLLVELVIGSVRVAKAVLVPTERNTRSFFVDVDLQVDQPLQLTVVADLLSLVPGSLTVNVNSAPPRIRVHAMGHDSPEMVTKEVKRLEHLTTAAITAVPPTRPSPFKDIP